MRKKTIHSTTGLLAILIVAIICGIYIQSNVVVLPGNGFGRYAYTYKDSIMYDNRHMGYVNFELFQKLAAEKLSGVGFNMSVQKDSVIFNVLHPHYLYGQNDDWTRKYKNLPIIITNEGFRAKLQTKDSIQYVYLPYQILANVARINESSGINENGADEEPRPTIKSIDDIPSDEVFSGKKIQTEGLVRQNVADILSHHQHLKQRQQMEILWKYAKEHWNYLNDPYSTTDTWRPASETIADYYFINGACYTGDCDDFAILMASFARQVGYESKIVAAYSKEKGGHAYAMFKDGSEWIPMDWFSDKLGGECFRGEREIEFTDL